MSIVIFFGLCAFVLAVSATYLWFTFQHYRVQGRLKKEALKEAGSPHV